MAGIQKRELPLTRQLPCWSFFFHFLAKQAFPCPATLLIIHFFANATPFPKQHCTKTMLHSYNAVICENQLSSSAATTTTAAVTLIPVHMRGLMLAKLSILHMRAGTLLQAAL